MTIQEWFEGDKIKREDLEALGEESDYSARAANFILEKWETDADELTMSQTSWAGRILEDMVERRITGQRRARF